MEWKILSIEWDGRCREYGVWKISIPFYSLVCPARKSHKREAGELQEAREPRFGLR